MSTAPSTSPSPAAAKRPTMYHSCEQVAESQLIPAPRWAELMANINSRLGMAYDRDQYPIPNTVMATFPDGRRMLYLNTGGDESYARRQLLAELLTDSEIRLINECYSSASRRRSEEDRFARASYVPAAHWKGWVCDGDTYHESVEAYLDQWHSDNSRWDSQLKRFVLMDDAEPSLYVWAARPQPVIPPFDVADVVEHWVCDRGWEDMDVEADLEGVPALQAAIDAFVAANAAVVSYHEDRSTAVILPEPARVEEGGL